MTVGRSELQRFDRLVALVTFAVLVSVLLLGALGVVRGTVRPSGVLAFSFGAAVVVGLWVQRARWTAPTIGARGDAAAWELLRLMVLVLLTVPTVLIGMQPDIPVFWALYLVTVAVVEALSVGLVATLGGQPAGRPGPAIIALLVVVAAALSGALLAVFVSAWTGPVALAAGFAIGMGVHASRNRFSRPRR
jgi:hypothetical protein